MSTPWEIGDRAYIDLRPSDYRVVPSNVEAYVHAYFGRRRWGLVTVLEVWHELVLVEENSPWKPRRRRRRATILTTFLRRADDFQLSLGAAQVLYSLYIHRFGIVPGASLAAVKLNHASYGVLHDLLSHGLAEYYVAYGLPPSETEVSPNAVVITLAGWSALRRYLHQSSRPAANALAQEACSFNRL